MGNKVHKMPPVHVEPDRPDAPLLEVKNETPQGFQTWVGVAGVQGRRATMEDATIVSQKDGLIFLGVFDGHGGSDTSNTLAATFPSMVLSGYPSSKPFAKRKDYLITKTKEMDQTLFHFEDGSTAVFGILSLTDKWLDVGNLGDSRLVVIYKDGTIKTTEDHKPEDIAEMKRISRAGGFVSCHPIPPKHQGGPPARMCRVNGNLATSRAFGDFHMGLKPELPGEDSLKYAVSDVPEVYERSLTNANFIVLACDGLWDVMVNEEVAQFLSANKDQSPFDLASALVTKAYDLGSTDNISVIVVDVSKGPFSMAPPAKGKPRPTKGQPRPIKGRHRSRSIEAKV